MGYREIISSSVLALHSGFQRSNASSFRSELWSPHRIAVSMWLLTVEWLIDRRRSCMRTVTASQSTYTKFLACTKHYLFTIVLRLITRSNIMAVHFNKHTVAGVMQSWECNRMLSTSEYWRHISSSKNCCTFLISGRIGRTEKSITRVFFRAPHMTTTKSERGNTIEARDG